MTCFSCSLPCHKSPTLFVGIYTVCCVAVQDVHMTSLIGPLLKLMPGSCRPVQCVIYSTSPVQSVQGIVSALSQCSSQGCHQQEEAMHMPQTLPCLTSWRLAVTGCVFA